MSKFKVIVSNKNEKWVDKSTCLIKCESNNINIFINPNIKYQKHMGFGGAFTDASVFNYLKLDKEEQNKFVKAYFSKKGLNYNLGRYPIHSTDFSPYSYDYLGQGNKDLSSPDLDVDKDKINLVKKCQKEAKGLDIMMSVWSPFTWMKDNNSLYHGGKLLYDYYQPWAKYLVNVIDNLLLRGVNITALTPQNEPEASQTWESCRYSPKEEAMLINHIYNELHKKELEDIHIYAIDHNRDLLPKRIIEINKYLKAPIFGVAYHWYDHSCFDNLSKTHELFSDYHLLMSECCVELLVNKDSIGSFTHAEMYAHEMINDFNNYSEGYIDWNLLLDEKGGPNHVGNYCESPIMMNDSSFNLLPTYYYIGHFSKYIDKGSIRIANQNNTQLEMVSYLNSNNKLVLVLLNKLDSDIDALIKYQDDIFNIKCEAHSIVTILEK